MSACATRSSAICPCRCRRTRHMPQFASSRPRSRAAPWVAASTCNPPRQSSAANVFTCVYRGAAMPSFDIVSELNAHEVSNAVDQANRAVETRFDFKGTNAKYEMKDFVITMSAQAEFQLKQMLDILFLKLSKRGVDVACTKVDEPVVLGQTAKQLVTLREGIDTELGKKLQRLIKDSKLKVQAAIQDKQVRVTGKSRDDLQEAIALIRGGKLELPLQFTNFRD